MDGSEDEEEDGERQSKRPKKWFENDRAQGRMEAEEKKKNGKKGRSSARSDGGGGAGREIETFDELEAEAARLLG